MMGNCDDSVQTNQKPNLLYWNKVSMNRYWQNLFMRQRSLGIKLVIAY